MDWLLKPLLGFANATKLNITQVHSKTHTDTNLDGFSVMVCLTPSSVCGLCL